MTRHRMPIAVPAAFVLLLTAACSFALTDIFRADFENCPSVPGDPIARVGGISTGSTLDVLSSGGGFSSVCLRVNGTLGPGTTNFWNVSRSVLAGNLSLRWAMNLKRWGTDANPVSVRLVFHAPTNAAVAARADVSFGTNGTVRLGTTQLAGVQVSTNVIHRFRLDYDLNRAEARLWIDDALAGAQSFTASLEYPLDRAEFEMPPSYGDFIWLDNLSLAFDEPWIPLLAATFDAMPHGTLVVGQLPGYPVLDAVTNIVNGADVYVTNNPSIRANKALCVGGTDVTVDFAPNSPTVALDGRYVVSFTVTGAGTNTASAVRLKQSSRWIAGALFEGTNILAYDSTTPVPVSTLHTNSERAVTIVFDTATNVYDLFVDGVQVVTNWPVYQYGIPEGVRVTTESTPGAPVLLDNIVFARRGRSGLFALESQGAWRSIQEFNTPLSAMERINVVEEGGSPHQWLADGAFGADGYLYIADPFADGLRVIDPYTLNEVSFYQDAHMVTPQSVVSYGDGRLAVLDDTNILIYTGMPQMTFERVLVNTVSNGNDEAFRMRLSHDQKWLLVATDFPDNIHRYDARTGQYLGALAAVTNSGVNIDDLAFGPDDKLYLLDTPHTNLFVFDYRNDVALDVLSDTENLILPAALGFLHNGNLLISDGFTYNRLHEYDRFTGEHLAVYEPTNADHLAMTLIPSPPLETLAFERGADASLWLTANGDFGRYYGISQASTITAATWTVAMTNALATNSWPRLCATNSPTAPARFYGVFECGF